MSKNLVQELAENGCLDASQLSAGMTAVLVEQARSLSVIEYDEVMGDLGACPNFVGSSLFEQLIGNALPERSRRLWATGHATVQQAAAAYAAESSPQVRGVLALKYDLGPEAVRREFLSSDYWVTSRLWADVAALAHTEMRDKVPVAVWAQVVISMEHLAAHKVGLLSERGFAHLVTGLDDLLLSWRPLAAAVLRSKAASPVAKLAALKNPGVSAAQVVRTLGELAEVGPVERAFTYALESMVENRPVLTAPERAAVDELLAAWKHDINYWRAGRAGDFSARSYQERLRAARSEQELLDLVGVAPAGYFDTETVAAAVRSAHATAAVVREVLDRSAGAVTWSTAVSMWRAHESVWEDVEALAEVMGCAHDRDPSRWYFEEDLLDGWEKVLRGPSAAEFTARVLADPSIMTDRLWRCAVPWSGHLGRLARLVPAGLATQVGSPDLLAAVLGAIEKVGDGSAAVWSLVGSFGQDESPALGDVLDSYVFARAS